MIIRTLTELLHLTGAHDSDHVYRDTETGGLGIVRSSPRLPTDRGEGSWNVAGRYVYLGTVAACRKARL